MRLSMLSRSCALFMLAATCLAPPVLAGQVLTIEVDQSQMVILPTMPGSVVIGNPSVADASIEGARMFLHGRSFGTTNIIILDLDGAEIAAFDISVGHSTPNALTLIKGGMRYSYTCAPSCESEFQIGDSGTYSSNIAAQMQMKNQLATGQTSSEAAAPPVPQ